MKMARIQPDGWADHAPEPLVEPGTLCVLRVGGTVDLAVFSQPFSAATADWAPSAFVRGDSLVMPVAVMPRSGFYKSYACIACPDGTLGWLPTDMLVPA